MTSHIVNIRRGQASRRDPHLSSCPKTIALSCRRAVCSFILSKVYIYINLCRHRRLVALQRPGPHDVRHDVPQTPAARSRWPCARRYLCLDGCQCPLAAWWDPAASRCVPQCSAACPPPPGNAKCWSGTYTAARYCTGPRGDGSYGSGKYNYMYAH
jgi:hypothetical protein